MKENEAIEKLKNMRLYMQITDKNNDCKFTEDDYKANEMAIQALEKRIPKKPRKTDSYRGVLKKSICLCMPYLWKCTFRKIHERTAEYSVLLGLRSKIRLER